jgi:hypothetical protein
MVEIRQEKFATVFKDHKPMANDVPPFDLKQEILKLKKEFDLQYSKNEKSGSSENLKTLKFMAILGQGAFGVVVN